MKTWIKHWGFGAVILILLCLGGCRSKEALMPEKRGEEEYGRAETMVIVSTERLRYEALYSDKIWTVAVDNRGTTFETALITQIHDFMRELKTMSRMAREEGVELSSREKGLVKEAAEECYRSTGSSLASQWGLEQQSLEMLYTDYWISEKLVERLTENMNLEVSDSEAKVITVSQIEFEDRETANEALVKLMAEGADFSSVSREYSGDREIRKQVFRGLYGSEYEEAAFALPEGEISGILSDSGRYYILKCVDDYDEAATRIRKEQMIRQKKNEAFYGSYQEFKQEMELIEDPALWRDITITGGPASGADFFEIFQRVCLQVE